MQETIEWPPPRHRFRQVVAAVSVLLLLLVLVPIAVSLYVETLWFETLGYAAVFWRTVAFEWGTFAAFALLTFAVLYGAFLGLRRLHRGEMPSSGAIVIGGQPMTLRVAPVLDAFGLAGSLVISVLTGLSMRGEWPIFARFWFAAKSGAAGADPVLGRPVSFYLFSLPAWDVIAGWLTMLAVLVVVMAGFFLFVTSRQRVIEGPFGTGGLGEGRGISFALAFLLLAVALEVYLGRFDRLLADHTVFSGATYLDAHVTLPGMLLVCGALVLGALLAVGNAVRGMGSGVRVRSVATALAPALLCYLAVQVCGWYVGNFIVKPNELVREQPYIAHNIAMTRTAYALDKISQREFSAQTTVESADAANNQATLQNIRLWDWRPLQDTLRQIQEIRTYYDFPDIDLDRYEIGGSLRQVMLGTRELNLDKLPESSRNWINEKLIYTHGYGITMNPVNGFTAEGLPTLMLGNMPVQSTVPGLDVARPEIYFGELTNTDVYVKTRQKEFNYPQGQSNSLTSYEGSGGIVVGGLLRRIVLAFDRGDLAKLPFSDDVQADSRLLMRRNIRERVMELAPFLTYDTDPYIVLGEDGRLSWIIDAFTTTDSYPYSRHYTFGGASVNYARNSVKVVIDAYDGTTTMYAFDPADPVLATYRRVFPTLFRDVSAMPANLRKHVRYSEATLRLQADVYGLYHMTDPEMFYNREDLWTEATEARVDDRGERTTQTMDPNFVLMKLPGEKDMEFVDILPFTPANRNNLIGWIAGRSDGEHYGSTVVYNFPKTRLVDGPLQIEARIDQNAQLSGQLTLWNQQGSHVRRGSLLVIPTGSALLYAEPIYLQAERSPMPELRLVVLALQDRLAYGPTFEAAMAGLFGGAASSTTAVATEGAGRGTGTTTGEGKEQAPAVGQDALIRQAADDLREYQRLTSEGKLGEAGTRLEHLKSALEQLQARGH